MPRQRDGSKGPIAIGRKGHQQSAAIQGILVVEPVENLWGITSPSSDGYWTSSGIIKIELLSLFKSSAFQLHKFLLVIFLMASSTTCLSQTFRAPVLQGNTLSGIRVDSSFYKGKLTILSFFYIGCMPCMKEIPVLNRLRDHFADRPVQVVAVAPHSQRQLREWNTPENTGTYRTEPIRYEVLPECTDSMDRPGFSPVCYTLSRRFGVSAYPTSVFIGPNGDLLMTAEGFPLRENQDETLQELIRMVEEFLAKR
jgi:hypothetical protein